MSPKESTGLVVLALALALVAPAPALGELAISAPDSRAFEAGFALLARADPYTTGPQFLRGGWLRPIKRNRWRGIDTYSGTLLDGNPIRCTVVVITSKRWWRYPPALFGCPVEWNPTGDVSA